MKLPYSYYNAKTGAAVVLPIILVATIMLGNLIVNILQQAEGARLILVTIFGPMVGVLIWLMIKLARHLLNNAPILTLTQSGVTDHRLRIGEISWQDIEGAYVRAVRSSTFICLNLHNENNYVARLPSTTRFLHSANKALGFTPIVIALSGVNANTTEVLDIIKSLAAQNR